MTKENEAIAEKIIQFHKDNDDYLDWTSLYYGEGKSIFPPNLSETKQYEILEYLKSRLVEHKLIEVINETGDKTRLRNKADTFVSFAKERKIQSKKDRQEKIKSWPQRRWYIVQPLTFLIGALSSWFLKPYLDKTVQKEPETNQPQTQVSTKSIPPDAAHLDTNIVSYNSFDKNKSVDTGAKGQE